MQVVRLYYSLQTPSGYTITDRDGYARLWERKSKSDKREIENKIKSRLDWIPCQHGFRADRRIAI